jgi:hypothetical protein
LRAVGSARHPTHGVVAGKAQGGGGKAGRDGSCEHDIGTCGQHAGTTCQRVAAAGRAFTQRRRSWLQVAAAAAVAGRRMLTRHSSGGAGWAAQDEGVEEQDVGRGHEQDAARPAAAAKATSARARRQCQCLAAPAAALSPSHLISPSHVDFRSWTLKIFSPKRATGLVGAVISGNARRATWPARVRRGRILTLHPVGAFHTMHAPGSTPFTWARLGAHIPGARPRATTPPPPPRCAGSPIGLEAGKPERPLPAVGRSQGRGGGPHVQHPGQTSRPPPWARGGRRGAAAARASSIRFPPATHRFRNGGIEDRRVKGQLARGDAALGCRAWCRSSAVLVRSR